MSDFKWKHFRGEIILGCVRWYCKYGISYRDLVEMMIERGVEVDPRLYFDGSSNTLQKSKSAYAGIISQV